MEQTCPACGADNVGSARYCRKCGIQMGSSQFTEAPTRNFEDQRQPVADHMSSPGPQFQEPPRYTPPMPSQPSTGYQPHPNVTGVPQRINTSPITTGPVQKKGANWLLIIGGILLAVILAAGMLGIAIFKAIKNNIKVTDKPTPTVSAGDKDTGFTVGGPSDPDKLPSSLKGWYYEDSTIEQVVSGRMMGAEGAVLIMKSEDDVNDIADFYRDKFEKIKNKQEVKTDDKVIFSSDGANVVIEPDEDTTGVQRIIVSLGGQHGIPEGIPGGVPGGIPGGIPAPPAPPPPPAVTVEPPAADQGKTQPPAKADSKAPKAKAEQKP